VGGFNNPPMGVHLKCMIGGGACAQNHGGSWTPAGGGVEKSLTPAAIKFKKIRMPEKNSRQLI